MRAEQWKQCSRKVSVWVCYKNIQFWVSSQFNPTQTDPRSTIGSMDYNEKPQSYQNDSENIEYSEMHTSSKCIDIWQLLKIICLTIICLGITATTILSIILFSREYHHIQGLVKDDSLPSKFYLKDMTPNQNQGNRATCWFGTTFSLWENDYFILITFLFLFFLWFS